MKSICPHCNTEYPDTPDEFLGMTCECTNCHNNFVVEKVKFCSDCGAANAARAMTCCQCGKRFSMHLAIARPEPVPTFQEGQEEVHMPQRIRRKRRRISSADSLSGWDKFCISSSLILGVFAVLSTFSLAVGALNKFSGVNILIFFLMALETIAAAHSIYLIDQIRKPNKKIYWTAWRKFDLTIFCIMFCLAGIAFGFYLVIKLSKGSVTQELVGIVLAIFGCFGSFRSWALFDKRAHEDADYDF